MKRLRRWLFNGITALSLALFVAIVALWVRSYFVSDYWLWQRYQPGKANEEVSFNVVASSEGRLGVMVVSGTWGHAPLTKPARIYGSSRPPRFPFNPRVGISGGQPPRVSGASTANGASITYVFPHWAIAVFMGVLPAIWLLYEYIRKHSLFYVMGDGACRPIKLWARLLISYLVAGFAGCLLEFLTDQGFSTVAHQLPMLIIPLIVATITWPYELWQVTVEPAGLSLYKIAVWIYFLGAGALSYCLLPHLRRKAPGAGFCPTCGYDLRATPERCPECGTSPPKKEIASI